VLIETRRGLTIRTAASLREMLTEIMLNSGPDIAKWVEGEAKRCADIWRESARRDAEIENCTHQHPHEDGICLNCGKDRSGL
jgi:hypothetical protein